MLRPFLGMLFWEVVGRLTAWEQLEGRGWSLGYIFFKAVYGHHSLPSFLLPVLHEGVASPTFPYYRECLHHCEPTIKRAGSYRLPLKQYL